MTAAADLDEIEKVNVNCIFMANLQQALTSSTQTDSALVYDTDESAENNNDVIFEDTSVEQGGETVEEHSANFEETRALYESLYQNLAIKVEKVNSVNRKLKKTNADLTTELKNQLFSFFFEEKKKLKSDFKTDKDELLDKQIQLEKKIKDLNNIVLKTGQSIQTIHMLLPKPNSFYHTEQKMALDYQNPFYLKQAQKKQQSLYDGKVLLEKLDPPVVHDSEETLQLAQENNTKTRRTQPRSNTKNDRVPSVSKSSRSKNKDAKVEEHHRNLLLSKNTKHMSFACNNIKLDSQNVISKVVCAMCKQCLISVNHDVCLRNYVKGKTSHGCSKHMTGDLKLLINFMWKFMGTVCFGNDHVAVILGFGDLQWGNILITRVYFVEGLGHNFFSVGQFCDLDLEVVFRRNACFVRNLEGVDLLKGYHSTNLYTINLHEMASASPICLMARASSTKSWLWHQRKKQMSISSTQTCSKFKAEVHFLRSKDEAPEVIKTFLKRIIVLLQSPVIIIRTENGTEFKNQVLKEYFNSVGISHQMSSVRTPQQNGVVEQRNRTALCYPKNDRKDIGKLGAKGLDLTYAPSTITTLQPTEGELDLLFEAMYDDYIGGQPSATTRIVLAAQEP
nr:integrase, catalytic region, zinc finger, CCHC-type, peptidase aspartic, catalytic [Tanacetum cinerariifolium]